MRRAFLHLSTRLRRVRTHLNPPLTPEQADLLLRIKYPCC
jgi:hypothetical protein